MNTKIMNRLLREYDELDEDQVQEDLGRGAIEHTPEEFEAGSKALEHLRQALAELKIANESKAAHYGDWQYYIEKVEQIISTDNGEAGLEPFVASLLPA